MGEKKRQRAEKKKKRIQESERRHLLILGAARSGTTLLSAMIGRHDEIGLMTEEKRFGFMKIMSKPVIGTKLCVPNQIEFEDQLSRGVSTLSKYPLEEYFKLRDLKMVLIVRNGKDVVSSSMRRKSRSFEVAFSRWRRAIEILYELTSRFQKDALVVSYESLVTNPEWHMRRVSDLLGLEYQTKMLEGYRWNRIYPEYSSIDPTKATPPENDTDSLHLENLYPDIWGKYMELRASGEVGSAGSIIEERRLRV
jgi:hypothetical protein